jgi:hypothetical protein
MWRSRGSQSVLVADLFSLAAPVLASFRARWLSLIQQRPSLLYAIFACVPEQAGLNVHQ